MSLHRSLKTKPGALNQHRNVLNRAERITFLRERGLFDEEMKSPMGLVKVANRKVHAKKKAAEGETAEAGAGETPAAAAAPAAAAPAAKAEKKAEKKK